MKRTICLLVMAVLASGCVGRKGGFTSGKATADASTEEIQAWIASAEEAWAQRADKAGLSSALEQWERVLSADANNVQILTSLARGYYFLAEGHTADVDEKLGLHDKGAKYGERALYTDAKFKAALDEGTDLTEAVSILSGDYIGAMYWTAANLGRYGVTKGIMANLFLLPKVKAYNSRVMELQEDYFYAGPHRFFGAFYAKAPGFAGGDMDKSVEHFNKAIELAPDYFGTRVLYAEFYAAKKGDKALFDEQLSYVQAASQDVIPDLQPEQAIEQSKAKKLLGESSKLFK